MCGIVGKIDKNGPHMEVDILRMLDTIENRGPDGKGFWISENHRIALGHRRLSILDLSSKGNQPMTDGRCIIVHNGEIYNYIEIRAQLIRWGYQFESQTDTEVILAAYDKWGEACLEHFNGMFAFAVWDKFKQTLFLARDRLGIKPLYYCMSDNGIFYFASEIKSILADMEKSPEFDPIRLDDYMSFGYVPGEQTLFKGINRLLPGHYLRIDTDLRIIDQEYWNLQFSVTEDRGCAYYLEKSRELLNDSIDLRLRSDVPLGIFLSGGIDSSAVVGLLAPRVTKQLKTFSVAYDMGKGFNETPYARQIARTFNTDHHEFFMSQAQFRDFVPEFVRYMDEPVTESAAISLYYISKMAQKHVTVVLSGEGSDEIFAGYDFYRYMAIVDTWHKLVGTRISRRMAGLLPHGSKIRKYMELGAMPLEKRYKGISTYEEGVKDKLYTSDFREIVSSNRQKEHRNFAEALFLKTRGQPALNRMLYFDTKTWLVDDLLIKADRMSMAASIELRVPFLDHRIVEFAAAMPPKYKIHKGDNKYLLKQMMKPVLPDAIINRKKMGFPTPLKQMFETGLADDARDLLTGHSCRLKNFFKQQTMNQLIQEHVSQKRDHHRILWQLVVLETWMQTWLNT